MEEAIPQLISSKNSFVIFLKNTSRGYDMVVYMLGIVISTRSYIVPFQRANKVFIEVTPIEEPLFVLLLVTILYNVRTAKILWQSLIYITTLTTYPSKNFTRKQCPNLVKSVPPHDFFLCILWYNPLKEGCSQWNLTLRNCAKNI